MVVTLDSIPPRGMTVRFHEDMPWVRDSAGEGLDGAVSSVAGELHLSRHGAHVFVHGALRGVAEVACDRCAEPLPLEVRGDVATLYSPLAEVPERGEEDAGPPPLPVDEDELPVPAVDQGEYDGQALDLRDVVREFFVLERPPRVTCGAPGTPADEACLERWRTRANHPADDVVDPRFSVLRSFKPSR